MNGDYIINIKTKLDESAKQEFKDLISDLNKEDGIDIKTNLASGLQDIDKLKDALKSITTFANELKNIKINISGNAIKQIESISNGVKTSNKSIMTQVQSLSSYKNQYENIVNAINENTGSLGQGFINNLYDLNNKTKKEITSMQNTIKTSMEAIQKEINSTADENQISILQTSLEKLASLDNRLNMTNLRTALSDSTKEMIKSSNTINDLSNKLGGLENLNLNELVSDLRLVDSQMSILSSPIVKEIQFKIDYDYQEMMKLQSEIANISKKQLSSNTTQAQIELLNEKNKIQTELQRIMSNSYEESNRRFKSSTKEMISNSNRVTETYEKLSKILSESEKTLDQMNRTGVRFEGLDNLSSTLNQLKDINKQQLIDVGNVDEVSNTVGQLIIQLNKLKQNSDFELSVRVGEKVEHAENLLIHLSEIMKTLGVDTSGLDKYSRAIANLDGSNLETQEVLLSRIIKNMRELRNTMPFDELVDDTYATSQRIRQLDSDLTTLYNKLANSQEEKTALKYQEQINDKISERIKLANELKSVNGKMYNTDVEKKQIENREKYMTASMQSLLKKAENYSSTISNMLEKPNIDKNALLKNLDVISEIKSKDFTLFNGEEMANEISKGNIALQKAYDSARKVKDESIAITKANKDAMASAKFDVDYSRISIQLEKLKRNLELVGKSSKEVDTMMSNLEGIKIHKDNNVDEAIAQLKLLKENVKDINAQNNNFKGLLTPLQKAESILKEINSYKSLIPEIKDKDKVKELTADIKKLGKELKEVEKSFTVDEKSAFKDLSESLGSDLVRDLNKQLNEYKIAYSDFMNKIGDIKSIPNIDKAVIGSIEKTLKRYTDDKKNGLNTLDINADTDKFINQLNKCLRYINDSEAKFKIHIDDAEFKTLIKDKLKSLESIKIDMEYQGMNTSSVEDAISTLKLFEKVSRNTADKAKENFKSLSQELANINKSEPIGVFEQMQKDLKTIANLKIDLAKETEIGIKENISDKIERLQSRVDKFRDNLDKPLQLRIDFEQTKADEIYDNGLLKVAQKMVKDVETVTEKINNALAKNLITDEVANEFKNKLKLATNAMSNELNIGNIENVRKALSSINKELKSDTKIDIELKVLDNTKEVTNRLNALQSYLKGIGQDTSGLDSYAKKLKEIGNINNSNTKNNSLKALNSDLKELSSSVYKIGNIKNELGAFAKLNQEIDKWSKKLLKVSEGSTEFDTLSNKINKAKESMDSLYKSANDTTKITMDSILSKSFDNLQEESRRVIEGMGDSLTSIGKDIENLAGKNLDVGKLVELQSTYKDIQNIIDKIRSSEIVNTSDISKLNSLVDGIKKSINSAMDSDNISSKFVEGLEKASRMLKGIEVNSIALDVNFDSLNSFKSELKSIEQLAKVNVHSAFAKVEDIINRMSKESNTLGIDKNAVGDIKQYQSLLEGLSKQYKDIFNGNLNTEELESAKAKVLSLSKALDVLEKSFEGTEMSSVAIDLRNKFDSQDIIQFNKALSVLKSEMSSLTGDFTSFKNSVTFTKAISESSELEGSFKGLQNSLLALMSVANKLDFTSPNAKSDLEGIKSSINSIKGEFESLKNKSITIDTSSAIRQLEEMRNTAKNLNLDSVISEIDNMIHKFKQVGEVAENALGQGLKANVKECDSTLNNLGKSVNKLNDRFDSVSKKGKGMFSEILDSISQFTPGFLIGEMIEDTVYQLGSFIKDSIVELDKAYAEIGRVLPDNITPNMKNYEQIGETARSIAKGVGQSTEDVIVGMATALQEIKSLVCTEMCIGHRFNCR